MIVRGPVRDVTVPDVTLPAFVLEHADARGGRPALIEGPTGRTLTHAEVARAVRSVAAGLAARGFGAGDVLALCAPNAPEYAVVFHAVAALGGVVTTINPAYTAKEMGFQLGDAGARLVIAAAPFEERAREAGADDVLVLGEAPFDELLATEPAEPPADEGGPDDVVALPYSSGTTGLPKASCSPTATSWPTCARSATSSR
jgi:acyl-CoA synthetase (AMP-forming)/AMP-acid ligase II